SRASAETATSIARDHSRQLARGLELFKSQVGPLLNEQCVKCHGGEKTKGELDLTTREGLLKGGAEGPDVIAGKSKQSKLLKLVSHSEEPHMPAKAPRLSEDAIAHIAAWIDAGAPYAQPLVAKTAVAKPRA